MESVSLQINLPQLSDVLALYESVGWTAYTANPQALYQAVENSWYRYFLWKREKLIGLLRAVSDGQTIVYVQDLLIHPDYQRKGLGKALLTRLREDTTHIRQLVLLTDNSPEITAFYKNCGLFPAQKAGCICFLKIQ